jgi:hypothetical protein
MVLTLFLRRARQLAPQLFRHSEEIQTLAKLDARQLADSSKSSPLGCYVRIASIRLYSTVEAAQPQVILMTIPGKSTTRIPFARKCQTNNVYD